MNELLALYAAGMVFSWMYFVIHEKVKPRRAVLLSIIFPVSWTAYLIYKIGERIKGDVK